MRHSEPVKQETREGSIDGERYSHPSFGMVHVSHRQGDEHLFGSEVKTSSSVSISIEECEVNQSLGRNWYHGRRPIVEIQMTPVQYAEMISHPNASGVPCTIRYRNDIGHIEQGHIDTVTQYAINELNESLDELPTTLKDYQARAEELLKRSGTLKKDEKMELLRGMYRIVSILGNSLDFRRDSVLESIDKARMEAKAEISHHIQSAINKLGIDTLKNPEAIKLITDGRGDDDH